MNYFRMGVSVPVPNFRFKHPYRWSSTFNSAATAGSTTLLPNTYTPPYGSTATNCDKYFQNGDKIILGPSTNSSYSGKTEVVTVRKISGNTITTESAIANSYLSGDPIGGEGTLCPQGWFPNYNLILPKGIYHPDGGKSDDYVMKLFLSATGSVPWMRCPFNYQPFKNSLYYQVGCYYKSDVVATGETDFRAPLGALIGVCDGIVNNETWISGTTGNNPSLTWAEYTQIFATQPDCVEQYTLQPHIRTVISMYGASGELTLWLDDFYIQHSDPTDVKTEILDDGGAYGINSYRVVSTSNFSVDDIVLVSGINNNTSGYVNRNGAVTSVPVGDRVQLEGKIINIEGSNIVVALSGFISIDAGGTIRKKGNCYYQFTEYPELNSVQVQKVSQFNHSFKGGKLIGNSPYGDAAKLEAYKIQMSFPHVSTTFLSNLKKYILEQEKGNYLIFHLRDNLTQLSHPFLIGFMDINGEKHDYWDNNYVSFNLTFTGF